MTFMAKDNREKEFNSEENRAEQIEGDMTIDENSCANCKKRLRKEILDLCILEKNADLEFKAIFVEKLDNIIDEVMGTPNQVCKNSGCGKGFHIMKGEQSVGVVCGDGDLCDECKPSHNTKNSGDGE